MSGASGGRFGTGFFIGALFGAGVALLIAPERGEERQGAVVGTARGALDEVRSRVNDVYARGSRLIEAARAELDAAVDEGKAAAEAQRIQLEREARHTPERA